MNGGQRTLRSLLASGQFVIAPGVFEMVSAKIADRLGFPALYMTGYGISASHMGLADAGLTTYSDMVQRAGVIAGGTRTPLIADADTGYGGLLNVRHTVRGYEAAGVQAIQLEDQETPKKCGHTPGRRVVPLDDMLRKIDVAVSTRNNPDTLIVARTDARSTHDLGEAIRRGVRYAKAGADIIFVEAPESIGEFAEIGAALKDSGAYALANMVPGGRSPIIPSDKLARLGFALAIYPTLALTTMAAAVTTALSSLRDAGISPPAAPGEFSFSDMHDLVGFPDIWDFERRHALPEEAAAPAYSGQH